MRRARGVALSAGACRRRVDHLRGGDLVEPLTAERPFGEIRMERAAHALWVGLEPALEVVEDAADDGVFVGRHQRSSAILAAAFAAPSVSTGA